MGNTEEKRDEQRRTEDEYRSREITIDEEAESRKKGRGRTAYILW